MTDFPTLADIKAAAARIAGAVVHTPTLRSRTLSDITGADIWLKFENLQFTAAYKERGALNKLLALDGAERARGVVAASAGNHAQAVAYHGRRLGIPVTIVMPVSTPTMKVTQTEGHGATVILYGERFDDAHAHAKELEAEQGLVFVHPFDDPAVIAGNGTAGLELIEDVPDVDVVVVGVGGGGLISGIAAAVKGRRPGARVIGIEPEGSNALSLALGRNEIVTIQPRSVADGLNAPFAGLWTMAMARRHVNEIVLIDDATILGGLRFGLERLKQVMEPAGAAALAAVLAGRVTLRDGERVAVVVSGGNVEVGRLGDLVAGAGALPGGLA